MLGTLKGIDYQHIQNGVRMIRDASVWLKRLGTRVDIQHENRHWEYGSAVEALMTVYGVDKWKEVNVLDVGSGCSPLGPTLALQGVKVTECEPDHGSRVAREVLNSLLQTKQVQTINVLSNDVCDLPKEEYDAVFCVSVLEHVKKEQQGWKELAKRVKKGGLLFITTDCVEHKDRSYQYDALREKNYTLSDLKQRVDGLKAMGFKTWDEEDWLWNGPQVYDYTFFRVGMVRG